MFLQRHRQPTPTQPIYTGHTVRGGEGETAGSGGDGREKYECGTTGVSRLPLKSIGMVGMERVGPPRFAADCL